MRDYEHGPLAGLIRPRSYWLREALDRESATAGADASPAPLEESAGYDVVIVGGGYTGLWTAYFLTERDPGARIALVEQDICGAGPSGRNGGFVHGWWDQLPLLAELYGPDRALELAWAADAAVDGIRTFCEREGVDAWYRHAGYMRVSASSKQDGSWSDAVRTCEALGVADQYHGLTADEVRRRCTSPRFRAGAFMPNAATVQPARLARGLRRAVLERGVAMYESTRARRILAEAQGMQVVTDRGTLRGGQAVLAVNAWAAGWPGFRTALMAWGSAIVLTEPAPDRLAEIGWTGGEAITDSRFTVHYFRTTPDGRVAFGAGVGPAAYGARIGPALDRDPRAVERARDGLLRLLPAFADVDVAEAWGGPIDVSSDRLPMVGSANGGRIHYAHGYSGNGVAPAYLAGRILAARLSGSSDPLTRLAIVDRRARRFPPEPFRSIGARIIREALIRHDEAADREQQVGPVIRELSRLPRRLGYRLGPPLRARRLVVK